MMNIYIEELTVEDSQQYLALRRESEIEYPQYVGPSAERELMAGEENIDSILSSYSKEGTIIFGAFNDRKLLAVLAVSRKLSPKFLHRAFIWGMYVHKEHRGSNVGALLLKCVQDWASSHDEVKLLWLQVTESNKPAISFYSKYGFETYGTEAMALFTQGEYHDVHYMQVMA